LNLGHVRGVCYINEMRTEELHLRLVDASFTGRTPQHFGHFTCGILIWSCFFDDVGCS
jgi:hypothetical protein